MMYMLYEWRESLMQMSDSFGALRVFQYQTFRGAVACILAFLLCVMFGKRVIRMLTALKLGQPIRGADEVHKLAELHESKAGTPTMGGVLLLGSVLVSTMVCARLDNPFVWTVVFVLLGMGILGFIDDYTKVAKKSSDGVSARFKLIAQFAIALIAGSFLYYGIDNQTTAYFAALHVPFFKAPVITDMGPFCLIFFAFVIVGCSNAVNLTDGLDGLATGCTITVALAYSILAYLAGNAIAADYLIIPSNPHNGELAIICMALVGAGMGFLWFNCYPAKVFMGDTGSLALGGTLGIVAICCRQEFVLVIVGGVFVMEAMSVILQVGSFKLRGKRIFKMSPIHHHFELSGWKESQVIVRFWIASIIFALIGLATLKLR